MKFSGLAVPGGINFSADEDLIAVWRMENQERFQNYRALFTVLDQPNVPWEWLDDLVSGVGYIKSIHSPTSWEKWVASGVPNPLRAIESKRPRKKIDQLPQDDFGKIVLLINRKLSPREFELAAKEITQFLDNRFINLEITPENRDGDYDVIGDYIIGEAPNERLLRVFIEAKNWSIKNSIGVRLCLD